MHKQLKLTDIRHTTYSANIAKWRKFRYIFNGGDDFINHYLKKFSARENTTDYRIRKSMTYNPAYAMTALMEIVNAITERLVDVHRVGGPRTYQRAINGHDGGIDTFGNTLNSFTSKFIMPELFAMQKVGVFIDKKAIPDNPSRADTKGIMPYLYIFQCEDICSWSYDDFNNLTALMLRDYVDVIDQETGLVKGEDEVFHFFKLSEGGVTKETRDSKDNRVGRIKEINIPQIPFIHYDIGKSLLEDVSNHQISLLNLASSDVSYLWKGNFALYTEQFNPTGNIPSIPKEGEDIDGDGTKNNSGGIDLGPISGRAYAKGLDRPEFIHPSPEPIEASMKKQDKIADEIRHLMHLALINIASQAQSEASKKADNLTAESGLSTLALQLEHGEREIAKIWKLYEGSGSDVNISYPIQYSLKSDEDRIREGDDKMKLLPKIPSIDYQREVAKEVITTTIGHRVSADILEKMHKQIDSAKIIVTDPETIKVDVEQGLVDRTTASEAKLYPKGSVDIAKVEHTERLAEIAAAQSKGDSSKFDSARGNPDDDSCAADDEKKKSQDPDNNPAAKKGVRS